MELSTINNVLDAAKKLNDRETARVLRQAICAEHDAVHLYEQMVDNVDDEKFKKAIQSIADEEKVHIGELCQLLSEYDPDHKKFLSEGMDEMKEIIGKIATEIIAGYQPPWYMKYLETAEDHGDYVVYRCKLCNKKVKESEEEKHFDKYHHDLKKD